MFSYFLNNTQKQLLLEIARLIQSFEVPIVWDGKKSEEITKETDLSKISLDFSESQKVQWDNLIRDYGNLENLSLNMDLGFNYGLSDIIGGFFEKNLQIPL